MPRKRLWLKVRVSTLVRIIARYELQQNRPAADAIRTLMRRHRIRVDETEVQRIISELSS